MANTRVTVIKYLKGEFKVDEIICEPGRSVEVNGEGAGEISFHCFDERKAILINDAYFDHRNKNLKPFDGTTITQKFKVQVKELQFVMI